MPVRIGSSYVSEAAVEFAKAAAAEDSGGNILKDLAAKFPSLKFRVGGGAFSGSGVGNVAISPKVLREMEENPDKRLEYEALLYDVANLNWNADPTVKASGVILDADGNLSMWGISKSGGTNRRTKATLSKDDRSWWQKILDGLSKKDDDEVTGRVGFNEAKRARQLAAAQTRAEVRAVLELLREDLDECKAGLEKNMCDEAEVRKVEAMIERAQERMSELGDEDPAPNFSPLDILI